MHFPMADAHKTMGCSTDFLSVSNTSPSPVCRAPTRFYTLFGFRMRSVPSKQIVAPCHTAGRGDTILDSPHELSAMPSNLLISSHTWLCILSSQKGRHISLSLSANLAHCVVVAQALISALPSIVFAPVTRSFFLIFDTYIPSFFSAVPATPGLCSTFFYIIETIFIDMYV